MGQRTRSTRFVTSTVFLKEGLENVNLKKQMTQHFEKKKKKRKKCNESHTSLFYLFIYLFLKVGGANKGF